MVTLSQPFHKSLPLIAPPYGLGRPSPFLSLPLVPRTGKRGRKKGEGGERVNQTLLGI